MHTHLSSGAGLVEQTVQRCVQAQACHSEKFRGEVMVSACQDDVFRMENKSENVIESVIVIEVGVFLNDCSRGSVIGIGDNDDDLGNDDLGNDDLANVGDLCHHAHGKDNRDQDDPCHPGKDNRGQDDPGHPYIHVRTVPYLRTDHRDTCHRSGLYYHVAGAVNLNEIDDDEMGFHHEVSRNENHAGVVDRYRDAHSGPWQFGADSVRNG